MKRKKIIVLFSVVSVLAAAYLAGPKPATLALTPELPVIHQEPRILEQQIHAREARFSNIKPGNASRIVWHDSIQKNKTPYSIVYLHGFSASPREGYPVHEDIARRFGCNLYVPRLYAHGLQEQEPLLAFDEEKYLESAKEAVAEAKNLGRKVIVMGTSTGCTLALYIASANPDIDGLILYSPNIDLHDSRSFLLVQPWGLQLTRLILGGKYYSFTGPPDMHKYWNSTYRIEALIRLKNLLRHTMKKETFRNVTTPLLLCYYYKNEKEQDQVVSVPAMLEMYEELGTSGAMKRKAVIPFAGEHALVSDIMSRDIAHVERETVAFMQEVLHMRPFQEQAGKNR